MKDWVLSLEGDKWSVKFHVRDLGRTSGYYLSELVCYPGCKGPSGHFPSGSYLCSPSGFPWLVVRSMFIPGALHGIEASLLASGSLRKLRSSIHEVVWSRRQPLASVGAVHSLMDGPTGCDPAYCVVWFRFRMLRRYLALWPCEVGRVYRLLEMAGEGCPGHGPVHLLVANASENGFQWDPLALGWSRPGVPLLGNLAGPVQQFWAAILDAWRGKVAFDLCAWEGFRGGPLLDVFGSLQLLNSAHVRERDMALLRSVMVGSVWNGFLLGRVRGPACALPVLWCS